MSIILPLFLIQSKSFSKKATQASYEAPKTLEELRKAKPEDIAKLSYYDGRKYGIMPKIRDQGNDPICWSYATMTVAEINILRNGLWNESSQGEINFCELNNAFTSLNNNGSNDPLGLTLNDNFGIGAYLVGHSPVSSVQRLLTWHSPVNYNWSGITTYREPLFIAEDMIKIDHYDRQAIKMAISKYGAVTMSYDTSGDKTRTYYSTKTYGVSVSAHACAIIGWDDNIPKEKYNPTADLDGGWIIRNSWGEYVQENGYFYISYDSKITLLSAVQMAPKDKYEYNYHYDSYYLEHENNNIKDKVASIFPVKKSTINKKELLKAVNVGFIGQNVTVTVEVYTNVDVDRGNIYSPLNNPMSGKSAWSKTEFFRFEGCYHIEIDDPIELEAGTYFSIVVNVSNPAGNAKVALSSETSQSNNDMTYYKDGDNWTNCGNPTNRLVARIKAFTITSEREKPENNDLKYSTLKIVGLNKPVRYGEDLSAIKLSVKVDEKELIENDD